MRALTAASLCLSKFRGRIAESKFKSFNTLYNHSIKLPSIKQRLYVFSLSLPSTAIRQFSSAEYGKIFREKENEYAHLIMEKSNSYTPSIMKFPLNTVDNWDSEEPANVFDSFAKITVGDSSSSTISNPKYTPLIQQLCSQLPEASDDQVKNTLHNLCMWAPTPTTHTINFKELWNTLDQECTKRCRSWDVSFRLLIADYWFGLRVNRITHYNQAFICSLLENCDCLSSHQIVQLMFYINLQREIPVRFLPDLEQKIGKIIDSISLEELGIICLAYFKTESKISSHELIQSIVRNFVTKMDQVNTITIAAVLKFLRKSCHLSLVDVYIPVFHKSLPFIKSWDVPTSVHLALLSSECNIYHPLLLVNVADKLTREMKQARIKDCTKLSLCLTHFNHFEEDFYDAFVSELKISERQEELKLYPKDIVFTSLYYSYMGKYDYEILAKVFDKDFVQRCCSDNADVYHPYAVLDYCVEVECKDYSGPRLESSFKKVLSNRRGNIPSTRQQQNMQTRLLGNFHSSLKDILGSDEHFTIRHILPHVYTPDIILQLPNQNKKSIKKVSQTVSPDVVLTPPKDELWVAFVICGSFSFAHRSKQITGVTAMKLRQLELLGYHVVFVPFYELPQNSVTRKRYIGEHIKSIEETFSKVFAE